ncbi:hypothetical protein [Pedobacter rhizosphaerae]|uniref:Uncharacterized protein n=1 Tax=Pedobacter rhizosphaerae TaxID=390241 RepID=A0A1H9RKB7_9SPHI|nr:hypothetical protein [Pedobacter rhizosphaerae]SER73212.1 hypothetical protein SAMN04488023_1151 [Pedobacter rhizosphaerae]
MHGIDRNNHEYLKSILSKLECFLETNKCDEMTQEEALNAFNDLNEVKASRLRLQALYVEYLSKLSDIEMHIQVYQETFQDIRNNLVKAKLKEMRKQ